MPIILQPTPLPQAVARFDQKTPVASVLRSAEWAGVPVELREAALWSAGVTNARFVSTMQDQLSHAIGLRREAVENGNAYVDRSSFIGTMASVVRGEQSLGNLGPVEPGARGTVRDLASRARLGLIYDMQVRKARGYSRWKLDQNPTSLNLYPAQRLIRIRPAKIPRDWDQLWADAGEAVQWDGAAQDEMIALKTSPIWVQISEFGVPWPPFRYGSGMGLVDVPRARAEALGLLDAGERLDPEDGSFTDALEADTDSISREAVDGLAAAFGDAIEIVGTVIRWAGRAAA